MEGDAADRLAKEWEAAEPKSREEVEEFYRKTKNYIEDLKEWNSSKMWKDEAETVLRWLRKYECKRILDFGGGIGSFAKLARDNGFECDYYEINEASIEYARRMNGLEVAGDITKNYDAVVMLDVVEHLPEPEPILAAFNSYFIICNFHNYVDTPLHVFNDKMALYGIMQRIGCREIERDGYLMLWRTFRSRQGGI